MSEVLQLTEVALMVVEMTETLTEYTVKFERVEWYAASGPHVANDENAYTEPTDALIAGCYVIATVVTFVCVLRP